VSAKKALTCKGGEGERSLKRQAGNPGIVIPGAGILVIKKLPERTQRGMFSTPGTARSTGDDKGDYPLSSKKKQEHEHAIRKMQE
jgi:hypothetical protein